MRFKNIFIGNLAEIARKFISQIPTDKLRKAELEEDFGLADRFLISDSDNLVLITSWPINKEFLKDTKKIFNFKNTLNLFPEKPTISICEDIVNDQKLKKTLVNIIKENNPEIYSYAVTSEFISLINFLKKERLKFKAPEEPKTAKSLVSFFDSKAGFRETFKTEKIGQGLKIKMPSGFIARSGKELINFSRYFYRQRKNFVIKANDGLGGAGLKIVDIKKVSLTNFKKIIRRFDYYSKEKSVIEEFIKPDLKICGGSPSIEYLVLETGIYYLYSCGMRIKKGGIFRGIEIGKGAVPLWIEEKMKDYGYRFANILAKNGYRGYFDTDFVISENKKIYPLEANIRRTGGTHVYEAGIKLLGKEFLKKYYLTSNNLHENKKIKKYNYQNLKNRLKSLLFPINKRKKGLVITGVNLLKKGKFGYIAIGENKEEVLELENKMGKCL